MELEMMKLKLNGLTEILQRRTKEVEKILRVDISETGIPVDVIKVDYGITIYCKEGRYILGIEKESYFLRGLGLLAEKIRLLQKDGGEFPKFPDFCIEERPIYDDLGVMLDCSRNAVLNKEGFERIVKILALMGYQSIQLYTEDTYEIPEYPYFGYMRGRFSADNLKQMDEYATLMGLEMVPCIQTLAHLNRVLHWKVFEDIADTEDILLAGEEKTYELIRAMFACMSRNVKSRRINIGMDEAQMLGLGKYLDMYGYQSRIEIMKQHFEKVVAIAKEFGYKPMMWSDMFFKLMGGEYYQTNINSREMIRMEIPKELSLIYWDYYSIDEKHYDKMLELHQCLTDKLVFAAGAWKWRGFSPCNQFSIMAGRTAHYSCVNKGIKQVVVTAWGDNGAEASLFSVLPVFMSWAQLCYTGIDDEKQMQERFRTCTDGEYQDFLALDDMMLVPGNETPGRLGHNPGKYLLYQDILMGLFDYHVEETFSVHYRKCAERYAFAKKQNPEWYELFDTAQKLAEFLEIKCVAGCRLRRAYAEKNKKMLEKYVDVCLPEMLERLEQFRKSYNCQWTMENKIFGRDVFDIRVGGLRQRVLSAEERLKAYLAGELTQLEELEEQILPYIQTEESSVEEMFWHKICTPSVMADC